MRVRCPSCQSPFDVAAERVPASGARARCSRCDTPFSIGGSGAGMQAPEGDRIFELPPADLRPVAGDDLFDVHEGGGGGAAAGAAPAGSSGPRRKGLWGWLGRLLGRR